MALTSASVNVASTTALSSLRSFVKSCARIHGEAGRRVDGVGSTRRHPGAGADEFGSAVDLDVIIHVHIYIGLVDDLVACAQIKQ